MIGLVDVVRAAAQLDVVDRGCTFCGERPHMMKFESAGFRASPLRAVKRAASAVSLPHRSRDRRWNVTRWHRRCSTATRLVGCRDLCPFEFGHEQRERALEDDGGITIRNRVSQQILRAAQPFVALAARGELNLERSGASGFTSAGRGAATVGTGA